MPDIVSRPLLNPVLSLLMDPHPEQGPGGGKGRRNIRFDRLTQQQAVLSASADRIYEQRQRLASYAGRTQLLATMFAEDSLAPSYTPDDLFGPLQGCQIVAPFRHGYVIEADISALPELAHSIERPRTIPIQCDISRVRSLEAFAAGNRLRARTIDALWDSGPDVEAGRLFVLWLAPYRDHAAQEALLKEVEGLAAERVLLPTFTSVRLLRGPEIGAELDPVTAPTQSSIARAMRAYRNTGIARATVKVPNREALSRLVASGISHRIDPVRPIHVAAPGEGTEPTPPPPTAMGDAPIVAVVDGGLHATSYMPAEAWRVAPLVSNAQADRRHGNAISSLVVQGHAWNQNRLLPQLDCRVGTVQAVPNPQANLHFDEHELIDYLAAAMRAHPETKIWNISANQEAVRLDADEISVLGFELNELARAAKVLPVVSVGNVRQDPAATANPPADCNAALVVGGRQATVRGEPAKACDRCLGGPGPEGMLKPDVSWFSQLRMIGGVVETGSSYPTALMSSLAAHTYANLRDPSPDLVKALLLSTCELDAHDAKLGWGTPYRGTLPWTCEPGSVTLAWRAELNAGSNYYWNEIPIPPEMVVNGKLFGRASLTAVLNPLVSPFGGANYFASRLQVSLQYPNGEDWKSLLGSMEESSLTENEAREELMKWQPVRRHVRDFTKRGGLKFSGSTMRLYARVFTRDLYQYQWTHHSSAGPQDVAFVLTLSTADGSTSIYDSMVQRLGNFVESAVVNQEIDVRNDRI